MKKLIAILFITSAPMLVHAQEQEEELMSRLSSEEMLRSIVILALFVIVGHFIITLIRTYLDHRLKARIIDAGASEQVIEKLLPVHSTEKKAALKYFCVLAGLASGLAIAGRVILQPQIEIAIIIAGLSLGFLAYFIAARKLFN